MAFMKTLSERGIKNIEMESLGFLALCRHAGIKGTSILFLFCVVIKNLNVTVRRDQWISNEGREMCHVSFPRHEECFAEY